MTSQQKSDTRKWLNRYRFLKKEIQAREKDLEGFIREIYNPLQSISLDGMPKGKGFTADQTHTTYARIEKTYGTMITEMQTRIEDLRIALNEIETAINSLDEYERCVCYHRFMLGIYWADLPAYIGYEQAQCARIECTALAKVRKMINNDKL